MTKMSERTMLEITKSVIDSRRSELPITQHLKSAREYFEEGCLCVHHGDISVPVDEPDDIAVMFYLMWCGCSRHYQVESRYRK